MSVSPRSEIVDDTGTKDALYDVMAILHLLRMIPYLSNCSRSASLSSLVAGTILSTIGSSDMRENAEHTSVDKQFVYGLVGGQESVDRVLEGDKP